MSDRIFDLFNKLKLIIESISSVILILSPDFRILEFSSAAERIAGKKKEDVLGENFLELFVPDEMRQYIARDIGRVLEGDKAEGYLYPVVSGDGTRHILSWSLSRLLTDSGEPFAVLALGQDITDLKNTEEKLRRSEQRYRATIDAMGEFVHVIDRDFRLILCNREFTQQLEQLGFSEDPVGKSIIDITSGFSPELAGTIQEEYERVFSEGKPLVSEENTTFSNIQHWTETSKLPIFDEDGNVDRIVTIIKDVTQRKNHELEIEAEKNRAQKYLDIAGVMFLALDTEGRVTLANRKACEILECSESDITGRSWFDNFIPENNRTETRGVFNALMQGRVRLPDQHENPVLTANGNTRHISWQNTLLTGEGGAITGTLSSGMDITEKKKASQEKALLEEQLLQAQKMEAIGRLAGGVAHDFNNLLTGIIGYANMLKLDMKPGDDAFKAADVIEKSALQASDLVKQLLGFARKGKFQNTTVNVHRLIGDVVSLLSRTIDRRIEMKQRLGADRTCAIGDPGQIHQVIMNLAVNSCDAMPEGGELVFETSSKDITREEVVGSGILVPGRHIVITVSDTGTGIPDDIMTRVFEPFFTTKPRDQGTGMGLAVVYGIVKNHEGAIRISSSESEGTRVEVFLPSSTCTDSDTQGLEKRDSIPGTGRILVIDDETMVLDVVERMLETLGYEAACFSKPADAVDYYRKSRQRVSLVIIDMIMPGMNGRDCFFELKKINPQVRALLSSGHTMDGAAQELIEEGMKGFVAKPFVVAQLSEAVAKALNRDIK